MSRSQPQLIIIRCEDFEGELENFESIVAVQWPQVGRVYLGSPPGFLLQDARAWLLATEVWRELPFILQQLLGVESSPDTEFLRWGDICLDVEGQRLRILPEGSWMRLTPKEVQLIKLFLKHPEHCLSHEDITAAVWRGVKVSSRSIASHISRLRRYLGPSQCSIKNLYGGGYQLETETS